jgi:hypothetical protein
MQDSIARIASRFMAAFTPPDPGDDENDLKHQLDLMRRLKTRGEARRLGRTTDIKILEMKYDGDRVWSRAQGVTDMYHPWITIRPRPGHHCDCPDWQKNGKRVGPCKHVLRLGEEWEEILINKLSRLD